MYLLPRGAKIEREDVYNNTPLGVGLLNNHSNYGIILIQKGADVTKNVFPEDHKAYEKKKLEEELEKAKEEGKEDVEMEIEEEEGEEVITTQRDRNIDEEDEEDEDSEEDDEEFDDYGDESGSNDGGGFEFGRVYKAGKRAMQMRNGRYRHVAEDAG